MADDRLPPAALADLAVYGSAIVFIPDGGEPEHVPHSMWHVSYGDVVMAAVPGEEGYVPPTRWQRFRARLVSRREDALDVLWEARYRAQRAWRIIRHG